MTSQSINYRQWGRGVAIGAGGALLIFLFLTYVWAPLELIALLPWILAFNCAHSGFYWAQKSGRSGMGRPLVWGFALGVLVVWICVGFLALGLYLVMGDVVFRPLQVGLYSLIGGGCGQAGAWLAVRAEALKG